MPNRASITQLAEDSRTEITIYNAAGHIVKTLDLGYKAAGYYKIYWNGRDDKGQPVASGAYFYVLRSDDGFCDTKKMILMK